MRISPAPSGVAIRHQPGSSAGTAASTLTTAQRGQFAASDRNAWTSPAGRSIVTVRVTDRAGAGSSDMRNLLFRCGSGRPAEVDVPGADRPGGSPGRRLVRPVHVRVRDDLVGRRGPPFGLVLRRMCVADEGRVVAPGE